MKRYSFDNFEMVINDDHSKELIFDKYKILEYKTKKSIEKYKTNFYMIDSTKGYGHNRVSAVYSEKEDLKEFYFDSKNNYYQATIENNKLVIDEIERTVFLNIVSDLKENIQEVAS